jgi:enamine deaminase RidA (YjgF/YER057c/UK114 family)
MSEPELEQRTNTKFLVKLGKSGNEIREVLVQVYGDNAMKKTALYKWVKHFSGGKESVTDEERLGRPATSRTEENVANIHQIVRKNGLLTVRIIDNRETVRKMLTEDFRMRKVCAKMVQKVLTEEQKPRRVTVCQDLLDRQVDILGCVIIGYETWVYQ